MRGTGRWRVAALVLLSLAAWPAAAQAQGNLVAEPAWHDFGPFPAGTTAAAIVDVWNDGTAPLTLGDIGFAEDPGPFAFGDNGCEAGLVLEPEWGCELRLTFTAPATRGEYETVAFVEDQAGAEVASALLTGLSFVPGHLVAEPAALDFGAVPRGTTSPSQSIAVRNAGDSPVVFSTRPLESRMPFHARADQCVGTLAPGATCEISVTFAPPVSHMAGPVVAASVVLRLQNGTAGIAVPVKGELAPALQPLPVQDLYGAVEEDLVRLAEGVPRLMRGGPRRSLRLPAFKAPTAGRLSVQVRAVGRGRRMRLATAALALESASSGRLRFKLGTKARKLLRQPRKTRVKVTVAFRADATGETFKQTLELTIRRPAKTKRRTAGAS